MPFAQLGDFEEAERLYLRVHAEQARHACADPQIANCPRACAEGPLTASRRSKAAALGEDHEATLRTRMGLVNVLAETGRGDMAEDICRRVQEVCFAKSQDWPFFLSCAPFTHAWISAGADAAARGGAPRHAAVAAEPRLPAGRQG